MIRLVLPLVLLASMPWISVSQHADATEPQQNDVVVYGGTSAAVTAAVQVARMGKSVLVVSPDNHLGGLTTGGLGWTDTGRKGDIGGLSRSFYQRVKKHYDKPESWIYERPDELNKVRGTGRYIDGADAIWVFEPHVAETVMESMIADNGIRVVRLERLNRQTGVKKDGQQIVSITTESGTTYTGKMFIDATYEGDLMASAGVSYSVGREANAEYGETINGIQTTHEINGHLFVKPVDPFVRPGDPDSGLLYGVQGDDPGIEFAGDDRIQAYNYRMCMTNVPENRLAWPKPDDYDAQHYELLFRNFEAGDLRRPYSPGMMPNKKTDTNNFGAFSTDNIGMNYDYPEGDYKTREKIIRQHESYQKGLMWSLANHPRVPEEIRSLANEWGLAKDEFTDSENWPRQLYIRESRRMKSDYVTTENDCMRTRIANDSVGLGSYNMDSHNCQRYVRKDGTVQNEGDIQISPGGSYVIGYRTIIPKRGEAENLLVPVCVSSTHIAFGSIRMEPVFMILGQSAATAACLAIDEQVAVQDVDYAELREQLLEDGQVLDLPPNMPPKRVLHSKQMQGIVVDDNDAQLHGNWVRSRSSTNFVDAGYRHNNQVAGTETYAQFNTTLDPGKYEVRIAYPAHSNRSDSVTISIRHARDENNFEEHRVLVNMKKTPGIEGLTQSLGTYSFDGLSSVTVETQETRGYVVIDAIQFLPVAVR